MKWRLEGESNSCTRLCRPLHIIAFNDLALCHAKNHTNMLIIPENYNERMMSRDTRYMFRASSMVLISPV